MKTEVKYPPYNIDGDLIMEIYAILEEYKENLSPSPGYIVMGIDANKFPLITNDIVELIHNKEK